MIPASSPATAARTRPSALSQRPPSKPALTSSSSSVASGSGANRAPCADWPVEVLEPKLWRVTVTAPSNRPCASSRHSDSRARPRNSGRKFSRASTSPSGTGPNCASLSAPSQSCRPPRARQGPGRPAEPAERQRAAAAARPARTAKAARKKTARPREAESASAAPRPERRFDGQRPVAVRLGPQPLDHQAASAPAPRPSRTGPAAAPRRSRRSRAPAPAAAMRAPVKPASAAVRPIRLSTGSGAAAAGPRRPPRSARARASASATTAAPWRALAASSASAKGRTTSSQPSTRPAARP